jgi:hypothetical protein
MLFVQKEVTASYAIDFTGNYTADSMYRQAVNVFVGDGAGWGCLAYQEPKSGLSKPNWAALGRRAGEGGVSP